MSSMAPTGPSCPAVSSNTLSNHVLRVRLAEIDGEMAELQVRLDQLATARIPIANALETIVYPILTIPPEITSEIFRQYVAEYPLHLPDSYTDSCGPPLLASICGAWRHIALNLQVIWSNITIYEPLTELLECCLARAGMHSLILSLNATRVFPGFSRALAAPRHLHTLVIRGRKSFDFLEGVTLPALEVLVLDPGNDASLPLVLGLFTRSGCQLRSISIIEPDYNFALHVLEAIPTVSEVHLNLRETGWLWDDELIPFFKRLATEAKFLSNLQTLCMQWGIRAVPRELVEMLESRRHQLSTQSKVLKAFKLHCECETRHSMDELEEDPDLLDRLRVLVTDGFELELPVFHTNGAVHFFNHY
ncbi:hypothetical protein B0H19DRAFT_1256974 [Mycena capillaripes]|nr:hypothetical protein B0H19DRAFT_1256974 [Mycena capillaripes]